MKSSLPRFSALLIGLFVLAWFVPPASADVIREISTIMERVKAKANAGRMSEPDLTSELLALSDLERKYKSRKAEAAEVLFAKAGVYGAIIGDDQMAAILLDQVRYDYPGTPAAARAEAALSAASAAPKQGGTHTGPGYRGR